MHVIVLGYKQQVNRQTIKTQLYEITIRSATFFDPIRLISQTYEGWNFNSGNYLFTTDTK